MRHDWTLLCTRAEPQQHGTIGLTNVFSVIRFTELSRRPQFGDTLALNPPAFVVSQWSAEFEADRQLYDGKIQLFAPGDEEALMSSSLLLDLRDSKTYHVVYIVNSLPFVGIGTYEHHILIDTPGAVGEWGRACFDLGID